ncbi:MAG: hypothetical protein KJ041_10605, partial [Gammaproteobacteria bacterium]|nr:hypothetical protein [Gammaproteobacteria bacterium]
ATSLDASATLLGTTGQIRVETEQQGVSTLTEHGREYPDTVRYGHVHGRVSGLLAHQASAFVHAVDTGERGGLCTVAEAAAAVRVVAAVEESLRSGGYAEVGRPARN